MSNKKIIYHKKRFVVWPDKNGVIVYNSKHDFKKFHTHARNKGEAKKLIHAAIYKKIPKDTDFRFLESLIRITDSSFHKKKIKRLIKVRKQKGPKEKYFYRPSFV